MLDNNQSVSTNNSITFNSVAGTLVKSHPKSKFARFGLDRSESLAFFDETQPHRNIGYSDVDITVLQVMLCGNNMVLVEFVDNKDLKNEQD